MRLLTVRGPSLNVQTLLVAAAARGSEPAASMDVLNRSLMLASLGALLMMPNDWRHVAPATVPLLWSSRGGGHRWRGG
eukprot:350172-Chlamydomonas_euryale.AAC.4